MTYGTVIRRLGLLAAGLVALFLIALGAAHLPSVRGRALEYARDYASRELGVRLRASNLRYSLFDRSVELRDVSLSAVSADQPFLQIDRAVVVLGPGIFLGRVNVTHVTLTKPVLTVVRAGDGTVNLPTPPPSSPGTQSAPLRLGIVSMTAFSARMDDRVSGRSVALGPFDLSVDTAATAGRPGTFGPASFAVRVGDVQTSGTIAGGLSFDGTRLRADRLTAETREVHATLDGWADVIGERPAVSSQVTATIDLPSAARLARVDLRGMTGRLDARLGLTGTIASPTIAVNADIASSAGSINVDGNVETADARPGESRLGVRWTNVDLDQLARAFSDQRRIRVGSQASGFGTMEFRLADITSQAWSNVSADATTTLVPPAQTTGSESLSLSGSADLHFDRGQWSLRHTLRLPRHDADLTGQATGRLLQGPGALRSTLGGRVRARAADIGVLPPLLVAAGVRLAPDATEGLHGSMDATIDLDGTTESPRARIAAGFRTLRAATLPKAADVHAVLTADMTGMHATEVRATAGSSSLDASGRYSWRGALDAKFDWTEGNLSDLASFAGSPVPVGGSATVAGIVSGYSNALHAVVTASASELTVDQVPVGALTANATLDLSERGLMKIDAVAPDAGARATLDIVNRTRYPVSGEISIAHPDVAKLVPARYRDQIGNMSGQIRATAHGAGQLADLTTLRGRVDVAQLDLMWRGTRVALASPGSVAIGDDGLVADTVDLRIGQRTRATLSGQLGVSQAQRALQLHLEGPLSELADIGARSAGTPPVNFRADGTATLDLAVRGTMEHPLPVGTLTVRSPSLAYGAMPAATDLTLDASIDPTLITLRALTGRWQGVSMTGQGALPWRVILSSAPARFPAWLLALPSEPGRATLTLRADHVTHAVLDGLVTPGQWHEVQGEASATVAVETTRLALEAVRGSALLDRAAVTLNGVEFTQDVPTRLVLDGGRARIEDFRWRAAGNTVVASGAMDLTAAPATIDVGLAGVFDLRLLGAFLSGARPAGKADTTFTVKGPINDPAIVGRIQISDAEAQWDSPRIAASDLEGLIEVGSGRKASIAIVGSVNTGTVTLDGTIDMATLSAPTGNLQLSGRGVILEYPSGFQTESNADLELELGVERSALKGRIDVLGGAYREPLVLSTQLLNLSSAAGAASAATPADWMSRLALDVAIATVSDVRIDNNYGRLDVGATFRLTGTVAAPGAVGRLEAADNGEIYVGGNTYRIERLAIDLGNPRAIAPELTFSAQTRVGATPIGIDLHCPANAACERKVISLDPNVDDKEAEAQLLGAAATTAAAGETLARLLSGEVLGVVGRSVGLDALRLEQGAARRDIFDDPTLIAGDVNPAARLTLAKRVGSKVELVYSQNLADDGFTWSTTYLGRYGMSGRLLILDDQSRAYEFRHEPPLGGARARRPPQPPGPRVVAIRIAGTPGFAEDQLRGQLRLREGDRFAFGTWQQDRDRLERFYQARNLLEARLRARRLAGESPDQGIALEYTITRGPVTNLDVRGVKLPEAVRDRLSDRWATALFDGFLEKDARTIVRDYLFRAGHLQASVAASVSRNAAGDVKTLTIDAVPGPVVPGYVEIRGNSVLSTSLLLDVVHNSDPLGAWLEPDSMKRLLESYCRSEGFFTAAVSVRAPQDRNGSSVVEIVVNEGRPYSIGAVELSGLPPDIPGPREVSGISAGDRYRPATVEEAASQLEARLRNAAYRNSRVEIETRVDASAARVDVSLRATPGPRSILRDVIVEGADPKKAIVARSIVLPLEAPLDMAAVVETRRRLYGLDIYKTVDVQIQPLATGAPAAGTQDEQPVAARIVVEERPRYRLRYGLAVNDEVVGPDARDQRLGLAADLENRNVLGLGASARLSLRLRSDQQVGRFTVGAKRFFGLPIRSTVFVEREREQLNPDADFPTTSSISTLTGEQAYRVRPGMEFRYGYGFERNHTFVRSDEPDPFDLTVNIARFTTSGLVDRRDDAFNPVRGWFTASTLEFSAPGLGSDLTFVKYFGQVSDFIPLDRGMVIASGIRVGLARPGEDEVLIPSERFYAGGANTVRGYREDDLGARGILGDAEGGSALLVMNGELRFPVFKRLRGVGFLDAGNVFQAIGDISARKLQVGAGGGARLDTPFGLIRFDVGLPVNRRPSDPRWRFHFGLGHAF